MQKAINIYPKVESIYKQGKDALDAEFKTQEYLATLKKHEVMELEVFMWGSLLLGCPSKPQYDYTVMPEIHRITEEFLE